MFSKNDIEEYLLLNRNIREKRRELRMIKMEKLDAYDIISAVKVNDGDMPMPRFGLYCVITNLYRHGSGVDVCKCPLFLEKEGCVKDTCPGKSANNMYISVKLQCEQLRKEIDILLTQRQRTWRKLWERNKQKA